MKTTHLAVVTFSVIFASHASADQKQSSQPTDAVWSAYTQQLELTCPSKQLDQLKPADLRDALDSYKDRQTAKIQKQMSRAEAQSCKDSMAGTSCDNIGDIKFARQKGKLAPLAHTICDHFSTLPQ